MKRLLLTLVLAVLFAPPAADAHTPGRLEPGQAFAVADAKVSWALYGEFLTGAEHFTVRLDLDERLAAPVEIFVPHEARLKDHRPAWALVGPGLPLPDAAELAALPAALPKGFGAIVELNTAEPRPVFYEFVMRRFYWSSGPMNVVLPQGASELWVWSPEKTKGKFGLGFGVEEGGGYMDALKDWSFYAY
jgi:hypothetical protein